MPVASKKIALVTGANKGIGFEIARRLAEHGMTALIGARDRQRGEAAVEKLRAQGLDARWLPLDVTREDSIAAAAAQVEREFGRLDVLVNNAGMLHKQDRAGEPTVAAFRETYETNLFAPYAVTSAFLPLLKQAPAARIVNVSSGLGSIALQAQPNSPMSNAYFAYSTSKSALNALTVHFARQLQDTRIKVNAAAPGHCATDMNDHAGPRTPVQGSNAPVRMAMIDDDGPTGGFFDEAGPLPW